MTSGARCGMRGARCDMSAGGRPQGRTLHDRPKLIESFARGDDEFIRAQAQKSGTRSAA